MTQQRLQVVGTVGEPLLLRNYYNQMPELCCQHTNEVSYYQTPRYTCAESPMTQTESPMLLGNYVHSMRPSMNPQDYPFYETPLNIYGKITISNQPFSQPVMNTPYPPRFNISNAPGLCSYNFSRSV